MKIKQLFSGDTDNTFIQFFRYVFVGGFAFVVDYGIMTALVELCRFDPVLAATISFVAGLIVNYVLSTFWIFRNSKIKNRLAEFAAFAAVGVVGLGINAAIIWFFKDILAAKLVFGSLLPKDKYYLVGKLFSTVIVFVWNFAGRKFIIFDKKQNLIGEDKI